MTTSTLSGKAQTVLGPIAAGDLGITLPHEHLVFDASAYFGNTAATSDTKAAYRPIPFEDLYRIRYDNLVSPDILQLREEETTSEALRYKHAGGSTIVDVTNVGIGREPAALRRIAQATGLNIVMGSGYYIGLSHPPEVAGKSDENIADEIVRDITVGVGDTGIRAGIIGEIGCSSPLLDGECKVLRGVAQAQQRTGAPVSIHPGFPSKASPFEIAKVLQEAGGDLKRTVMGHLDVIFPAYEERLYELAELGCYIEYDLMGDLGYFPYPDTFIDMPSEGDRVEVIKKLIGQGQLKQILISHDLCVRTRFACYGGHGYAHILKYIVPLMKARGIDEECIHTILVENPGRLLQFV